MLTEAMDAEFRALLDVSAAGTVKEFWRSASRVLRAAIPAASMWFVPDAEFASVSDLILEEPSRSRTHVREFWDAHPLRAHFSARPEQRVARVADIMTEAQLFHSKFYREFLAPRRERFSAAMAFSEGTTLRSVIGVNRTQSAGAFSPRELASLEWLHAQFRPVLSRIWKSQCENALHQALGSIVAALALPIILLDWQLEVLYSNDTADELAAVWAKTPRNGSRASLTNGAKLPNDIRKACDRLKENWTKERGRARLSSDSCLATTATCSPNLVATVRVLDRVAPQRATPLILVALESNDCIDSASHLRAHGVSQLWRLTTCEREVAALVCKGQSNKEVATHLGKSVLTVKAQLQSIYAKLGVDGRSKLMRLLQQVSGRTV